MIGYQVKTFKRRRLQKRGGDVAKGISHLNLPEIFTFVVYNQQHSSYIEAGRHDQFRNEKKKKKKEKKKEKEPHFIGSTGCEAFRGNIEILDLVVDFLWMREVLEAVTKKEKN